MFMPLSKNLFKQPYGYMMPHLFKQVKRKYYFSMSKKNLLFSTLARDRNLYYNGIVKKDQR